MQNGRTSGNKLDVGKLSISLLRIGKIMLSVNSKLQSTSPPIVT